MNKRSSVLSVILIIIGVLIIFGGAFAILMEANGGFGGGSVKEPKVNVICDVRLTNPPFDKTFISKAECRAEEECGFLGLFSFFKDVGPLKLTMSNGQKVSTEVSVAELGGTSVTLRLCTASKSGVLEFRDGTGALQSSKSITVI